MNDKYLQMIERGMPAEDARGLLPHNITTRLNYVTDLRALLDHGGNRLCTQAQFEWRMVWVRIIEAIREFDPRAAQAKRNGEDTSWWTPDLLADRWQWELLAGIFRPACYLTGQCEFKANFDRKCSIRDRVDEFAAHGVPSSEWGNEVLVDQGPEFPEGRALLPIEPREWLLDAAAAR